MPPKKKGEKKPIEMKEVKTAGGTRATMILV